MLSITNLSNYLKLWLFNQKGKMKHFTIFQINPHFLSHLRSTLFVLAESFIKKELRTVKLSRKLIPTFLR